MPEYVLETLKNKHATWKTKINTQLGKINTQLGKPKTFRSIARYIIIKLLKTKEKIKNLESSQK